MKVKDFLELDYNFDIVILDNNSRDDFKICNAYEAKENNLDEVLNADIESIDYYYGNCYYEGDNPALALYINYVPKPSDMDNLI